MEMDSSEGEMAVLGKSGHEREAEDEATKRRKIDADGVGELQKLEGKEGGEKMDVDEIREGEVLKKRDLFAEDRVQRVGVVFAGGAAEEEESDKGEGGCAAAKMDPGAEYQRTEGECHDSSNVQMEVEGLFLHREDAKKGHHEREVGDEAVKNLEPETGKMDQTRQCEASKIDAKAEERRRRLEEYQEYRKRKEKQKKEERAARDPEEVTDYLAFHARSYEKRWKEMYDNWIYGSFEDKTEIPCMRYTYEHAPGGGRQKATLQVFSVKVAEISGDLQWPINVFGMIALRDSVDLNRNMIFYRDRDNCQTLTEKEPYFMLTGPVRAVVLCGPVVFEVSLHMRGPSKSQDKEISLLAVSFRSHSSSSASFLVNESYTSRLTTLEFGLGHIVYSIEATIKVLLVHGVWPDGFRGHFAARTASINKKIVLLDSGDGKLPVTGNEIQLSRRVVSVESNGTLRVSVKASQGNNSMKDEKVFRPQQMGTHPEILDIGDCKIEVTVAWSLFGCHPKIMLTH